MNIVLSSFLILATTIAIYADPQYGYGFNYRQQYPVMPINTGYGYPEQQSYFRAGAPQASFDNLEQKPENRLFLGTITLTLATTTSTYTITSSTTCTTSTAGISVCSPSGRRRRGLSMNDNKNGRSLLYDGKESHFDGFFVGDTQPAPVAEPEPEREARAAPAPVPFVIQPGFEAPENVRGGRFLVAFGTSTIITTSTSTYTYVLTALCKSTTGYSTCSGNGR